MRVVAFVGLLVLFAPQAAMAQEPVNDPQESAPLVQASIALGKVFGFREATDASRLTSWADKNGLSKVFGLRDFSEFTQTDDETAPSTFPWRARMLLLELQDWPAIREAQLVLMQKTTLAIAQPKSQSKSLTLQVTGEALAIAALRQRLQAIEEASVKLFKIRVEIFTDWQAAPCLETLLPAPGPATDGPATLVVVDAAGKRAVEEALKGASRVAAPMLTVFEGQRSAVSLMKSRPYKKDFQPIFENPIRVEPIMDEVQEGISFDLITATALSGEACHLELHFHCSSLVQPMRTFTSTLGSGLKVTVEAPELRKVAWDAKLTLEKSGGTLLSRIKLPQSDGTLKEGLLLLEVKAMEPAPQSGRASVSRLRSEGLLADPSDAVHALYDFILIRWHEPRVPAVQVGERISYRSADNREVHLEAVSPARSGQLFRILSGEARAGDTF